MMMTMMMMMMMINERVAFGCCVRVNWIVNDELAQQGDVAKIQGSSPVTGG